jgi:glycosyltransferase involved in cell wall biosynthesis
MERNPGFSQLKDPGYWDECKKRIESLPGNVVVNYRGAVSRETVPRIAEGYHFFHLPTLGENFGYAILEAMAAGCPVVISDLTPWRDVEPQGAGWCLPLGDRELWRRILQQCVDMDQQAYATFSLRAREFVEAWATSNNHLDETLQLFNLALDRRALLSSSSSLGVSTGPRE